MIDQTLTTPPTAPSSNDIPTFRTRFDAFIVWIVTFVSQLTTVISQMNSTASTINDKETSTINASMIAAASANFKGTWNALSNVLANESYVYNGIFYRALQNSVGQTPPDSSVNYQNAYWAGYGATLAYINSTLLIKADDSTVVHKTGNETKAGVLTLSDGLKLQGQNVSPYGKNLLINSDFKINQRNYSSGTNTTSSNQYCHDRWRIPTSGQNITFSTTNGVTTITVPSSGYETVIENIEITGGEYVFSHQGTATNITISQSSDNSTYTVVTHLNGVYTITAGNYVKINVQGGTLKLPKFERGNTTTAWSNYGGRFGSEEIACFRYFEILLQTINCSYAVAGSYGGYGYWAFKSQKRVTPTIVGTGVYGTVTPTLHMVQVYGNATGNGYLNSGATASSEL